MFAMRTYSYLHAALCEPGVRGVFFVLKITVTILNSQYVGPGALLC